MRTYLPAILLVCSALVACGGTTTASSTSEPEEVSPTDATFVLRTREGLSANGRDTSACTIGLTEERYTFSVTARRLEWTVCRIDASLTRNSLITGQKTLSEDELAKVAGAISALRHVDAPKPCGADWSVELEVDVPNAPPRILYPPFLRCAEDSAAHVSGLEGLLDTVGPLAR